MTWEILAGAAPDAPTRMGGSFALVETNDQAGAEASAAPRSAYGSVRIEVDDLGAPEAPVAVDQRFVFRIAATDNREPEANVQQALPIRARVVAPEELLRRMQERLARARLDTVRLSELQREKRLRVEELVDAYDGDGGSQEGESVALVAALSGQRRVLGDAEALGRDLASIAEDILYARLDEKAGPLLDRYHARVSASAELRFRPEPWRELAAAAEQGQLGSGGFGQSLVALVGLALEISEDHVRAATRALDDAERAVDSGVRVDHLLAAVELQSSSLARMEDLLEELAEWDNFQNILALTRDILNRQKTLRERTQRFASEK